MPKEVRLTRLFLLFKRAGSLVSRSRIKICLISAVLFTNITPVVVAFENPHASFALNSSTENHNEYQLSSGEKEGSHESHFEVTGEFNVDLLLGSLNINSPINTEEDIDLYLIPKFSYYGERFYFENTSVGFSLLENERWTIDLIGRVNLDAMYFHTNKNTANTFLNFLSADVLVIVPFDADIPEIEEREYSYMIGASFSRHFGPFDFNITATKDASNIHKGIETDISVLHTGSEGKVNYSLKLGVLIKDKKISNYYYGLRDSETIEMSYPSYEVDSTTYNPYIKATFEKQLSQDWSMYFSYQSMSFDSKITDSILVTDEEVNTRFIGVKYRF